MGKTGDWILDVLASIIARLIMGAVGGVIGVGIVLRAYRNFEQGDWRYFLMAGATGAALGAIYGIRKGPGVI